MLLTTTDPDGNTTTYVYDTDRRLSEMENPAGDDTYTTYDANGNVATTADNTGDTTDTTYNNRNLLVSTTDPDGNITSYSYDTSGIQIQENDPNGDEIEMPVNAQGSSTGETDGAELPSADQRQDTTANDGDGMPTLDVDPMGRATQTVYNDLEQPVVVTTGQWNSTTNSVTGAVRVTYYQYDADGNTTLTVEGDGTLGNNRATLDQFNSANEVYAETTGAWVWTTLPTATVAGAGAFSGTTRTSYSQYDPAGNQILSVDPSGLGTQTAYNGDNEPTTVTMGQWVWSTLPTATTAGVGGFTGSTEVTSTTYDPAGLATGEHDAAGGTSITVYDGDGRPVLTIDPDLHATQTIYNSDGQVSETIDGQAVYSGGGWSLAASPQRITQFFYDDAGNQIREIDPDGATTDTVYDSMDNVIAVIEQVELAPSGTTDAYMLAHPTAGPWLVTMTGYDVFGDATSSTDAKGNTGTTAVDKDGEQVSATDPLGIEETDAYDSLRRTGLERGRCRIADRRPRSEQRRGRRLRRAGAKHRPDGQ